MCVGPIMISNEDMATMSCNVYVYMLALFIRSIKYDLHMYMRTNY